VDVQTAEKSRLATFLPSGLFLSQFMPFFDQYALSHRLWSPKSDAIVFPMVQDGISHLSIVQVESGEIDILTDGEIGFWSHQ
jgi:TolB protein